MRTRTGQPDREHPHRALNRPGSELVALADPVAPVLDRLRGLLVDVDAGELRERHRQRPAVPVRPDEHLVLALLLGRHPDDLDLIARPERRDRALGQAAGPEGKGEVPLEVVVPAHRLLLGPVAVDDDLHLDALLARLVAWWVRHRCLLSRPQPVSPARSSRSSRLGRFAQRCRSPASDPANAPVPSPRAARSRRSRSSWTAWSYSFGRFVSTSA